MKVEIFEGVDSSEAPLSLSVLQGGDRGEEKEKRARQALTLMESSKVTLLCYHNKIGGQTLSSTILWIFI